MSTTRKSKLTRLLISLTDDELKKFDEIKTELGLRSRSVTAAYVINSFYLDNIKNKSQSK